MATQILTGKQDKILKTLLEEVLVIKNQLAKFLLLIPEESLKGYKNSPQIKKAYFKVLKSFSPSKKIK